MNHPPPLFVTLHLAHQELAELATIVFKIKTMTDAKESTALLRSPGKNDELPCKSNSNQSNTRLYMPKLIKKQNINEDAIHFGIRMSVCLTVSSLFVLAQLPTDKDKFPEGMWVLITVLFVYWFLQLDAASVLGKSILRLIGTLIGASVAISCGFLSLYTVDTYGYRGQAVCLAICMSLVSFVVYSYAVHTKVIRTSFQRRISSSLHK